MGSGMANSILSTAALRTVELAHQDAHPTLMQRAGRAAADLVEKFQLSDGPILVMAGPGNNGGDGLVLATELRQRGRQVVVAFLGDEQRLPPDAAAAMTAWQQCGGELVTEFSTGDWVLAVDALFGIGLTRALTGTAADWISRFNAMCCRRLSLDIPSGVDADTGRVLGCAARATDTLSFIAWKPGVMTLDGPDHCGQLHLATLGLAVARQDGSGRLLARADFTPWLAPRTRNSHKGLYGDVGIVGGAAGMVGAAWIAGRAALALGTGRVFVGTLATDAPGIDPATVELMMRPARELTSLASVLAIGPGLGQSEEARALLHGSLAFAGPLVLDADALNLIGADAALQTLLSSRQHSTLMTPHPAEAARLLQSATTEVQNNRVAAAQALAIRYRAHVALKGCGTVVAHPNGTWSINTSGNPGMAVAGMGDALTGFAASLLAQHWPAPAALEAAVHLHGAAADALVAEGVGPIGMRASEVIDSARRIRNAWTIKST